MKERIFGHIPGYPVGSQFQSRIELSKAGVHRPTQAGISGAGEEGADSIVISGGYEDDKDLGETIIYTGHGGRDPDSGKQIRNQELTRQNLALATSGMNNLPVRVIRGENHFSEYSPKKGYRYDGLFQIIDHWRETGKSGFYVWRYKLIKVSNEETFLDDVADKQEVEYVVPARKSITTSRIIRNRDIAQKVKELHNFHCQVCNIRLETAIGLYAVAAHIRPLGIPHNGSDTLDNLLCLCPNHHVLFDNGAVSIGDDLRLIGIDGYLQVVNRHVINKGNLQYHREHYLNLTRSQK